MMGFLGFTIFDASSLGFICLSVLFMPADKILSKFGEGEQGTAMRGTSAGAAQSRHGQHRAAQRRGRA